MLIIVLLLSIWLIGINFEDGVVVRSIDKNSSFYDSGLRSGEIITQVDGNKVESKEDYSRVIGELDFSKGERRLDITTKDNEYTVLTDEIPEITVEDVPRTKIKTGLDLRGGARALVQPDQKINDEQLNDLIAVSSNRFNVFGLRDVQIRGVRDLEGNRFMLVEVAGASPQDLENLISQQGKFEAKVGNETVFIGGENDIADVCRNDATCAGITACQQASEGYFCRYQFTLFLTEQAAKKHAEVTKDIPLDSSGAYLTEKLHLFVDENEVETLSIGASLKGQVTTEISIQGTGIGNTQEDALRNTRESMNRMQTILITGSLPYKLNIVKMDTISPTLGEQFTKLILLAGIASILVVSLIIFIRYRKVKASLALLLTSFSEIIIILGVAAMIKWNLDLPSIAGILATIGTGVDSQIIILDEARRGITMSVKEKMKRALFVVFAIYFTSLASLIPLYWAGAGLFKGFAITTIIGITAGVFISRPAFAEIIGKIGDRPNAS